MAQGHGRADAPGETTRFGVDALVPVVNSYNEWDPLEEVIVGVVTGASVPPWHVTLEATMPPDQWDFFRECGGRPFPAEQVAAAERDLDAFVRILEAEGVTVRRPEAVSHSRPFSTPYWSCAGGLYAAMPRDLLLVVGDEIIEAPMAWRSRYFEAGPYRTILKDYSRRGARWTAAPKPELRDELYDNHYREPRDGAPIRSVITESEPTFDAADVIRCGRDLFVQRSHVTNRFGIDWLGTHLGDRYRVHVLEVDDDRPMHLDATFMPLAPGKLLIHPGRLRKVPEMFRGWDVFEAPTPGLPDDHPLYMTSKWISMNLLMLDEERVFVESRDEPMIGLLRRRGFTPIPCPFRAFNTFGGSFHCATLDVRRRGGLQSYF